MKFWFKRKKKHRFSRLAMRLERFFQVVWGSKLWIVTYSVAIATVYYGSNIAKGYPEDPTADEELKKLKMQQGMEDGTIIVSVGEKVQVAINSLQVVLAYMPEIRNLIVVARTTDGKVELSLDKQKASVGFKQVNEARQNLIPVLAGIKSAHFQTPYFMDFYEGYEEDFREVDRMLDAQQSVFNSAMTGNTTDMAKGIEQVAILGNKFQEAMQSIELRSSYSAKNMKHILTTLEIEGNKQERNDIILGVRALIWFFLVGLTFFLAILAFKSQRVQKRYTSYHGGSPELAKLQREKYKSMRHRKI